MINVDATDMQTCAILLDVEPRQRCGKRAATELTAHQPPHEDRSGTVWPELDLTFGICADHLEPIMQRFLKGQASIGSSGS